ncbi:MAG: D-arabinono-1,4-lactone oxidase [Bdellovibrionota bacterium]
MSQTNRRQFLKHFISATSSGMAFLAGAPSLDRFKGLLSLPSAEASGDALLPFGDRSSKRWTNWIGNISFQPDRIASPNSLDRLIQVVRESQKLHAVGSGHSFNGCVETKGTLINTKRLNRILEVDRTHGRVRVEAGMVLSDFNDALAKLGLALPSLGDVAYQTLGGVVSTATHGSGMKWGTFSDEQSILGADLVLANGSLLSLSQDRPSDHEYLKAARVGLGGLGTLYSLTFRVVEAFNLEQSTEALSLDQALDPKNYLENDHFEFYYFPFTEKTLVIRRNTTGKPRDQKPIKNWLNEIVLENALLDLLVKSTTLNPSSFPRLMHFLVGLIPNENFVDRSDQVMTSPRFMKAYSMEYAFPIEHARAALDEYRECVEQFASIPNKAGRYYANLPVDVRFVRADQGTYLSHAQGRDTCYIDIASHKSVKNFEPFFRALERRFLKLGGRPHWGKLFYHNPRVHYPEFRQYADVRQNLDPDGKFINHFMKQLLL